MRTLIRDIKLIKRRTRIPSQPRMYLRFIFDVKGVSEYYITRIEFSYKLSRVNWTKIPAKAYCSCPDFKFRFAYVHKVSKSLVFSPKLKLATKLPPRKTNPGMIPEVCKHILASIRRVQRVNKKNLLEYLAGNKSIKQV